MFEYYQKLKKYTAWLFVVMYMSFLFYLSSLQIVDGIELFPFQDKVVHLVLYFVLAILVARACYKDNEIAYPINKILIICVVYSFSDEIHQYFVPTRTTSVADIFADTLGSYLGAVLYLRLPANIKYI